VTHWAGLSPALGGFMMGVLLSRSPFRHQIAAEIAPYKGFLLGLFFISVGMSIDLGLFLASWASILLLVATLIAVKGVIRLLRCVDRRRYGEDGGRCHEELQGQSRDA
jgi:Kef-type K+ transport system membrane component KefB